VIDRLLKQQREISRGRKPADALHQTQRRRTSQPLRELPLAAHEASRKPQAARRAFTLIELLLAMFILAIGMVAIASIFPVAGYLQKNAFADVITLQVKRHAVAVVDAVDVPSSALPSASTVTAFTESNLDTYYPLAMRCYPQALDLDGDGVPNESGTTEDDYDLRPFFWVPLVQNVGSSTAPDYRYYVFILERLNDATYPDGSTMANGGDSDNVPKVVRITANGSVGDETVTGASHSGNIQPGDQVLASNGQVLQITEVPDNNSFDIAGELTGTIDAIWYARPHATGAISPTRRIIVFGGESTQ